MRVRAIFLGPLLGLGLVAGGAVAQEFDPDVLDCLGATIAAAGFDASLAAFQDRPNIALEIAALTPDLETAHTALIVRLFEGLRCNLNDDVSAAALGETMERELAPLQNIWRDLDAHEAIWHDLQPRLACHEILSMAEIERARQIIATQSGHPCV